MDRHRHRSTDSYCHIVCCRSCIYILLVAVVFLSSIKYIDTRHSSSTPNVCYSKKCVRSAANFKKNMNFSVDPCDDFYSYVCGRWADNHPRSRRWDTYNWYDVRQIKIDRLIRDHLETNISQTDPKPVAQAKDMYKACLRSFEDRDRYRFRAMKKYLKEFGLPTVPTLMQRAKASQQSYNFDWISCVAKIQRKLGLTVLIGLDFVQDHVNRDRFRLTLGYCRKQELGEFPWYVWSALQPKGHVPRTRIKKSQKSTTGGDPEDDDCLLNVENLRKTLNKLVALVSPTVFTTKANGNDLTVARKLQAFNHKLPALDDESKDEEPTYYTVAALQNITDSHITPRKPYPVWQHYLDVLFADFPDIKLATDEKLLIKPKNVTYLGNLIDFLSNQSPELIELYVWKSVTEYLVEHPLNHLETRDDCMESVNKLMGLAFTYAIAERKFLKKTKPRVEQMFNGVRSEFHRKLLQTDWIDAYTKNALAEKSSKLKALIGFPEWILNVDKLEEHYRGLQVDQLHHFENWVNALQLLTRKNLQFLRVNIGNMSILDPKTVNAYYTAYFDIITVPVGIIQYPFYDLGLEAMNYGALGHILGHEITHGFDASGRHKEKFTEYERWWSNHSLQEFDKRTSCLVKQYDSYYVPEAERYINGTLTLGENIADNGGIREAFRAYRTYVKRNGPELLLPGFEAFTHEQLFFMSFANVRCSTLSAAGARKALNDTHSPLKFRVQGALSNMEEFSEVFQCPRGSKMNPEKKCRVW